MKLKIGPHSYNVKFMPDLPSDEAENFYYGRVIYNQGLIEVRNTMLPQIQRVTLAHEVIHAILANAGFQNHDEHIVDAIATGMVEVLQRNRELKDYLAGAKLV